MKIRLALRVSRTRVVAPCTEILGEDRPDRASQCKKPDQTRLD